MYIWKFGLHEWHAKTNIVYLMLVLNEGNIWTPGRGAPPD